ncbi:ABC transporter permease [Candidatus Woesearchaeota archaeon]|nr:ABC transporter permease [Candidatus Woesearchaeota archaeon]
MKEHLWLALRSLSKRRKRAALTMIGVFIGIAAVVALVSLGQGLSKTINDQFEKVGADKIIIQAKESAGGFTGENAPGQLTETELDIARKTNGVTRVTGQLFRAINVQYNDIQRTMFVVSMPPKAQDADLAIAVNTWEAEQGRMLTHRDKQKAVIGYNLANKNTFVRNMRIGDKILVGTEQFEIVGVLKRIGDPTADGGIVMPEDDARLVLNDTASYSMIIAQSARGEHPAEVGERIEKAIRRDRHQKEGKEDFTVQTSTELIASFNTVFNIIQVVFVGIASISLLVGGVGIMNTMYTAVLERTREIGVMKAIGARNEDILTLFLIESGLLGFAGGLVGVIIGAGISKMVEFGANASFGPGTIVAVYPLWLVLGSLLFSTLVGAVSGILPARRGSHLKPVDALRSE